ncbi:hypothetical protein [Methylobacterium fujisawaense]|uniref:hypothetical protein n=1 Tax=Methylobacterium fujisawaense TaxID=107400 RepID=UPI0036F6B98C
MNSSTDGASTQITLNSSTAEGKFLSKKLTVGYKITIVTETHIISAKRKVFIFNIKANTHIKINKFTVPLIMAAI